MYQCRRSHGERNGKNFIGDLRSDYRQLLAYEKERSQRHNHFFTLIGLNFTGFSDDQLIELLEKNLRCSDYVFSIPDYDLFLQHHSKIGILLPETDAEGGAVVKARLVALFGASKSQVQLSLTTYPDDATSMTELLSKAFNIVPLNS